MKKALLIVTAVAASLVLLTPAQAGKSRVMEVRYENPAVGSGAAGGVCSGCPSLISTRKERYVSITVTDDVNPAAGVRIRWDNNGDGTSDGFFYVCAETPEPVKIPPGVALDVFPYVVGTPECPHGTATAGTVTATFSASPR